MKILIEIELSDIWGSEEELSKLPDKEIVEILMEDAYAMLEDVTRWNVIRHHR